MWTKAMDAANEAEFDPSQYRPRGLTKIFVTPQLDARPLDELRVVALSTAIRRSLPLRCCARRALIRG